MDCVRRIWRRSAPPPRPRRAQAHPDLQHHGPGFRHQSEWLCRVPRLEYGAIACLAIALIWGTVRGAFFQLRAAEWRYPQDAAAFVRGKLPNARVFNTYEFGGYLIWRGVPVFIDGRALREAVFL